MHHSFLQAAGTSDIPEIEALVNRAYRGDSSRKGWTTEADLLDGIRIDQERLQHMIKKEGSEIFIYRNSENKLLACVHLENQGDYTYLGMLTVDPELQGSGIGKKILAAAESIARGWQSAAMEMTVITDRKELIEWYCRHGYMLTTEKKPFPSDPRFGIPKKQLEFVVLRKKLAE